VAYGFPPLTCICNSQSGEQLLMIPEGEHEAVDRVAFSPDGKTVATGIEKLTDVGTSWSGIRLRDAATGQLVKELGNLSAKVFSFSPDGNLLAAGNAILSLPDGTIIRRLSLPERFWMTDLTFSPNGELIAVTGFVNGLRPHASPIAFVYETETGDVKESLKCPYDLPHSTCPEGKSITFYPDGKRVAIGTITDAFYLWNIESDVTEVYQREGGRWWLVSIDRTGKVLAATGAGGTVLLWDVDEGRERCALRGRFQSIYGLAFSPRADLLASGGMDGVVRLWKPKDVARKKWKLARTLDVPRTEESPTLDQPQGRAAPGQLR
jgi:WD40 repeat protein